MFRKLTISLLVLCQILFSCQTVFAGEATTAQANGKEITVTLDGKKLEFDVQPYFADNSNIVMVPFRAIAEALGAVVTWNDATKTINAVKDGLTFNIQINSDKVQQSDKTFTLDVPARIKDSRTFVPLHFFSVTDQATINWTAETKTAEIKKKAVVVAPIVKPETKPETKPEPEVPQEPELALLEKKIDPKEFSLLSDRLFVRMPEGTEIQNSSFSIMAAEPSDENVTSLLTKGTKQNIELYAEELCQFTSGSLKNDAQIVLKNVYGATKDDYTLSSFTSDSGMQFMTYQFSGITEKRIGVPLFAGAVIKASDNTLILVSFFASAELLNANEGKCFSLSDSILRTLKSGTRNLQLAARTVRMGGQTINLKKNYVLTYSWGIDFNEYDIKKVVSVGEFSPSMCICFDGYFGFSQKDYDRKFSGKILGIDADWYYFKVEDEAYKSFSNARIVIENTKILFNIYSINDQDVFDMKDMAESLTDIVLPVTKERYFEIQKELGVKSLEESSVESGVIAEYRIVTDDSGIQNNCVSIQVMKDGTGVFTEYYLSETDHSVKKIKYVLTKELIQAFLNALKESDFWNIPEQSVSSMGYYGTAIYIEGVESGKTHFIKQLDSWYESYRSKIFNVFCKFGFELDRTSLVEVKS